MTSPGLLNWFRISFIAIIWGGAFMFVRIALRDFPPLTLAAGRILIGAISLYAIMRLRGVSLPSFRDTRLWRFILLIALLSSSMPFALLSWGQQHVPSAFAGMTMAALPIFVLPLAHFFVPGEQIYVRKVIGFSVGFLGAVLLIGTSNLGVTEGGIETIARVACVTAAFCYACGSIATRQCPPVNELALSTGSLMVAALILTPIALIFDGLPKQPSFTGTMAILYLGLIPTALAFIIKVAVTRSAGPSFMTLTNYQVPVWSVVFGSLFLGEILPVTLFIALGLILLGLAITQKTILRSIFKNVPHPKV
jgi:drug/metabolite transporter (DMT)-like permease|tara:strand:- start:8836 stop:9759 length:924 start_codon:yes stop_codon:yes gene_type:complete